MKITRDKMFFSKDLIHTLAYVGMFVAAIISVGACKSGIWVAAILAWIVAGIIIGLAIISDYKKAELLKNGTRIIGKVTATKRVHIKFHMSTYHLADEDVIYPYVVHYQYIVKYRQKLTQVFTSLCNRTYATFLYADSPDSLRKSPQLTIKLV